MESPRSEQPGTPKGGKQPRRWDAPHAGPLRHSPVSLDGPQALAAVSALASVLQQQPVPLEQIQARTARIHQRLLASSRFVRQPNFSSIHPQDLQFLFARYDELFFHRRLSGALAGRPLRMHLSKRLTSAAGMTVQRILRSTKLQQKRDFEIKISTPLLFQTFLDVNRPITVTGVICHNRLEALQRVLEHELIHLAEMLAWNSSNCAAPRFQDIARNLFGHREHTHRLITQRERAWTRFGIRLGDRVTFQYEGRQLAGRVNRITRRATVLVESSRGQRYSDGRHYEKYYVPLDSLRPESKST